MSISAQRIKTKKSIYCSSISESISCLAVESYYSVIQLLEYYEKLIDVPLTKKKLLDKQNNKQIFNQSHK